MHNIGRKITKLRELRGMKQETLAAELGISQQAISKIEQSADVEDDALIKIAKVLGVTVEGLRHFTEDSVFNNINNFHDNSIQNNFNPIEKIVALYDDKVALLERLLASEREKVELLKNQGKDK
ncbi:helix-turn-helix domain-containing protein [Mucilaginibacter sp. BT774]|uniref:helix-turn-helix domain-containing protein n=1 Tax=Mucilaginibacter sp. BT774 TaxID=3062276 RepID=UPI0026755A46|nr:helix-turn-helix transcriptional regulator [Mucilaginibacter sp. BT774]MDO3627165.1 helix-turn-helix transcriptional regulator [Mucilaginibacter sp. BT774]